jgi:hypothetical protein
MYDNLLAASAARRLSNTWRLEECGTQLKEIGRSEEDGKLLEFWVDLNSSRYFYCKLLGFSSGSRILQTLEI